VESGGDERLAVSTLHVTFSPIRPRAFNVTSAASGFSR
jgi:hypothetical protein